VATKADLYPNALAEGAMLNEYSIVDVLGVGGFGITYLARDTTLEKDVAIKEYFPGGVVSRRPEGNVTMTGPHVEDEYNSGLDRFLKEARTLATFSHRHIVRVLRFFQLNGTGYMVMDYEHGVSLRTWLKEHPQPEEETLLGLVAPLLDGIEKVHGTGFLHRDIKPDNVFIRDNGEPVLIDFGSARQAHASATHALTAMVTPGYAPFEQYGEGAEQGPWTDIYAMGAVLVYAMTGRNPPDAIARMKGDRLGDDLASASLRYSPRVIDAVRHAMALDEKARPQSIAQWRPTLLGAIPGKSSGTGAAGATVRVTTPPDPSLAAAAEAPRMDTQDIGNMLAQREELERAMKQKFQRVLTVMFTDLKGSTAIAEAAGDLAVRAMLKRYHDLVTEAVTANKGTLVKTIGDGSLSHFEHALDSCRAAAAIQRGMEQINVSKTYKTLLLARIGMHTGECILEKNDVFGDVVNTASRFESSANPGEIFISEDTYNAISDKTEFYSRFDREVTLKGKSQPFKGYIVFWDPKEIERDRVARPLAAAARPSTPAWKMALYVAIPLLAILGAAIWITSGGKIGGEQTRSINISVPKK
jgi:serine/threonine protein kinase